MSPAVAERLRGARGYVFDMDGTLVLGDRSHTGLRALPGAIELTGWLRDNGVPFVVVTAGSAHTPAEYAGTLRQLGIPVDADAVQTPATVAADYFVRKKLRRVMVLGWEGARSPLEEAGLEVVQPGSKADADAIFIGYYRDFTVDHVEAACQAIWRGAKLFTSSRAPFFAAAHGRAIGIPRGISQMLQGITGCRAKVLGKPSIETLQTASRFLGVDPAELAVVGDDPVLEIDMAHRGGALAIGVTTGLAQKEDFAALPSAKRPHLVLGNVGGLLGILR